MSTAVKWFGSEVTKKMRAREYEALNKAGALLERDIKLSMKKGSYRKYNLIKPKRTHWSSVPGESPAVDIGRLRASITYRVSDGKGTSPTGKGAQPDDGVKTPKEGFFGHPTCVVGTNVKYGRYLELGTPRIKPRPFLRPALERNRDKILKLFNFKGK